MDRETLGSPRNGLLSPTTIMTSSEDHMLSDRRTMMLKRAHQNSEGSGRGEEGKNLRKRMHIEAEDQHSLHSETTDSAFSGVMSMPMDKPALFSNNNSDNNNIFQKFAGTHPGYSQHYDLMDDLAQQIEPIQHNNIEFESLDDDEFESNDNALFDFATLRDDNEDNTAVNMDKDMFLHDPELMVWDEALLLNDVLMTDTPPVNDDSVTNNLAERTTIFDGKHSQMSNKMNTDNSQKSTSSVTSISTGSSSQSKPFANNTNNHTKITPKNKRKNATSTVNNSNNNDNNNASNRGNYRCGRCGLPKVNHVCPFVDAVGTTVGIQVATPILQPHTLTPFPGEKFLSVTNIRKPINAMSDNNTSIIDNNNANTIKNDNIVVKSGTSSSYNNSVITDFNSKNNVQPPPPSMDIDDASSVLSFGPPPADTSPLASAKAELDSIINVEESETAVVDTFVANRAVYLQQQQQIHSSAKNDAENNNNQSNNHNSFVSYLCSVNNEQTSSTCFFCFS